MKRVLFIAVFMATVLSVKSQVIDTSFKTITACKIQPVKVKFTDQIDSDHLGVKIISNDLKSICGLYWQLLDGNGDVHLDGNCLISGNDYLNWGGNNLYPFTYVGNLLKLVFVKPAN